MKKDIFILTTAFILLITSNVNSAYASDPSSPSISDSRFEPGETIFIEIPGFDLSKIQSIKSSITSADVGAVWLGYCESWRVVCIKVPTSGLLSLETALKEVTGGYILKSTTSVPYSITDICFITE